jgi:environmental stress-induced protein Ves
MNMPLRLVPLGAQRVMPWANGGGSTREVAIDPEGAALAGGFRWRVSRAHVATDGPFSVLPGVDRSLWLLAGDGMVLASAASTTALDRPHQRVDFPGETAMHATLLGSACEDLNVMTRRGVVHAQCELRELAAGERLVVPAAAQHVLLALAGAFRVDGHPAVAAGGAALRGDGCGELQVVAATACVVLAARFAPVG